MRPYSRRPAPAAHPTPWTPATAIRSHPISEAPAFLEAGCRLTLQGKDLYVLVLIAAWQQPQQRGAVRSLSPRQTQFAAGQHHRDARELRQETYDNSFDPAGSGLSPP
jgi:hypothetical protein